jgi:hypothetical protein
VAAEWPDMRKPGQQVAGLRGESQVAQRGAAPPPAALIDLIRNVKRPGAPGAARVTGGKYPEVL